MVEIMKMWFLLCELGVVSSKAVNEREELFLEKSWVVRVDWEIIG